MCLQGAAGIRHLSVRRKYMCPLAQECVKQPWRAVRTCVTYSLYLEADSRLSNTRLEPRTLKRIFLRWPACTGRTRFHRKVDAALRPLLWIHLERCVACKHASLMASLGQRKLRREGHLCQTMAQGASQHSWLAQEGLL